MNESRTFLTDDESLLRSLLADDAKNKAMLNEIERTVNQLKSKNSFRIALINQLLENNLKKD